MKFSDCTTQKDRISFIRARLEEKNEAWTKRALVRIYENQTEDEQDSDTVTDHNGIGFTVHDAYILTKFAKWYLQHNFLSPKQMNIVFEKMPKYARQLERCVSK